ncbi:MAG: aminotransferase class III-fold pyridoxal phosphate-dependent enzyme [Acidimicrobiales bacterium]|jgi:predicted acetylornithine/succinylornithine family transaminase|nr:aminotransferase class III-fold pyridoxal phosphate-dependent enzyme [Acidimicrobiales bacterium]MDP6298673.1 aminotransferase class III-fold pyridoxal phosphate-dependent enzyme [Acidimicrobiales bacterium]HJM28847.1 aminotransferase class III-fold pyridoxal phosphate-dependent enzyme [Acidimicrobiales bacterium]HJM97108.1 aminotransferase class III-fold pyridoxal phosphate-dependent enzyme [Acidimicrobiales bacterium]
MKKHSEIMDDQIKLTSCPIMPTYGAPSVMFIKGKGTELWDNDGKRYLDFVGGLAVQTLGHANQEIADVLADQALKLTQVSNYWATEHAHHVAIALDKAITGRHEIESNEPYSPSGQVFFCNSGAEANELAFKIARKSTPDGMYGVITTIDSFHGRTLAALAACGQPHKHAPFAPMPEGFSHIERGDLVALNSAINETTAAIHLEPIQGEGGVWENSEAFMNGVEKQARDNDLLFMVDEVQSGLCRTGEWFAFQHYKVQPDVVCIAKALGNGFPIGAVWAKNEIASAFQAGDHGSTYGGNPLATSVARKVLEIMKRDNYVGKAQEIEEVLTQSLLVLPRVLSVRGKGAMLAAELDSGISKEVALKATENGLLVNPITTTALRFTPPLTTKTSEIEEAMEILKGVLDDTPLT